MLWHVVLRMLWYCGFLAVPVVQFLVGSTAYDVLHGAYWAGLLLQLAAAQDDLERNVVALEETELLEINKNVLHVLQRTEASRRILDAAYRTRVLQRELRQLTMFQGLSDADKAACAEFLRDKADLVRVDRGQVIFRQGDVAGDFFKVRLGFVKVSQRVRDQDRVIDYLGPGRTFGEVGLLSGLFDLGADLAEHRTRVLAKLRRR